MILARVTQRSIERTLCGIYKWACCTLHDVSFFRKNLIKNMRAATFLVLLLSLEMKNVLTLEAISSTSFPVCYYIIFVTSIMSILPDIGTTDMSDEIILAESLSIIISLTVPFGFDDKIHCS